MPTLNWIGKEAVINHHQEVSFRTLEKQYDFNCETQNFASPHEIKNKIIHGDNLEALKALLPYYEGKFKCIYIDPPYNTGNENWVYNDNVNSPKIRKWLGQVVGKEAEDLTRHDKWLCMMYPRLVLLRQLLADDGAIFISIDDNEQASLKLICDEIFGAGNFVMSMIVNRTSEVATAYTIQKHEYCLCYIKNIAKISIDGNEKYTISRGTVGNENQTTPKITFPKGLKCYGIPDGIYTETRKIIDSKENIENFTPIIVKDETLQNDIILKARWRSSNDMRNFFDNNCKRTKAKINGFIDEIYFENDRFNPQIKKLTTEKLSSLYVDNKRGSDVLKQIGINGFDYPKYSGFIEYLISLFTDKSSLILDSFAGSGTTAHAVLNLNKQDGGNRHFVLIEMEDYAETITAERVRRVINGYGEGKNAVEGTGGGFAFYELGEPLFNGEFLNENQPVERIREYIYYTETRQALPKCTDGACPVRIGNDYFLGTHNATDYYFYYEKNAITTLSRDTLNIVRQKADTYVIYADQCYIDEKELAELHIVFKKIPRDIRRF